MKIKFSDVNTTGWIMIGILVVFAVLLTLIARKKQKWTARMLANAAVCMALSFVLSYIRLFRMPQGGSITPASMLPICAFSYFYGAIPGIVVGLAYGVLQLLQDSWLVGVAQAILDYPLAFVGIVMMGILGSSKKFGKDSKLELAGWALGIVLTAAWRFVCHVLSGVVFFASYAEGTGLSPLAYSLGYNSFVFIDLAVCFVIAMIPQVRAAMRRMTIGNR